MDLSYSLMSCASQGVIQVLAPGAPRPLRRTRDYFDLVPYFERLCLRPSTPLASSVPRTM